MILKINILKFEYCFWIRFGGDKDSELQVADFARHCLVLFQSTNRVNAGDSPITIENQPTDDLCLLAAMSLIRLHEKLEEANECPLPSAALIQAAGILEHLILKSPHNYEALLLLVRIYLLLGAGSLSIKAFSKLTVKQMQYETVAHNLFTRLSTIHPHSGPPSETLESKDTDPQMAMRQALKFYRGSEASISHARKTGLDNGSYVNVEKSIGFQASLQNSICRRMWALETRRIQRMVGGPSIAQYDSIGEDPCLR
jgi:N-terminal acetyltransferase B complex non-catalytic subunit